MGIRWRLSALFIQLVILFITTKVVAGSLFTNEVWFFAGLLAVIINPQLLEPYYPKPGDVVANSIIFVVLYFVTESEIARPGWQISTVVIFIFGILALIGLLGSRDTKNSRSYAISRAARMEVRGQVL